MHWSPLGFEHDARPLRVLFLDLNAYFASVEQQEDPSLRGRPVAVIPLEADSTFVIAASYEAKAHGVKTGTRVGDAKRMCPELVCIQATPAKYTAYHRRILKAVETVLPIDKVCSIDEMQFRLLGDERDPEQARVIAQRMKAVIATEVGEALRCSVGVAPNAFLAKVGTELQKPDGLVVLEAHDLPNALTRLKLTDLPGINKKMRARLQAHGIFHVRELIEATPTELRQAFGSVVGERWWYLLRGYELDLKENERQSLGHSHVLPPEFRTREGAKQVLLRLTQKAAARLRSQGLYAQAVSVAVKGQPGDERRQKIPAAQDSVSITQVVSALYDQLQFAQPLTVYVTFSDLRAAESVTPSLFDAHPEWDQMSQAVDRLNQKFGKNAVYLAGLGQAKSTASEKIAFNKTWLFPEGKGDHQWGEEAGEADWINPRTGRSE